MSKAKAVVRGEKQVAIKSVPISRGTGNVFADLGLPDADEHQAKADLAHQLAMLIKSANLTQKEVAVKLGIDQPKVSAILRGRLEDFSAGRLMRFITAFHRDVVISIREPQDPRPARGRVLVGA